MKKKGIGFLLILSMVLILAACGSKDAEKRVFEAETMGITTTITYYHEDDKVVKQTAENVVPYANLGISSEEEAKEIFDPEAEKFQGIDGIKQKITYSDSEAVETLEVDYENLDFDKASELPGMMFDGDAKENGVSMGKSADMLLEQRFEEKE